MRKTMLLGAMMAMVLAAAVPAFAQAIGGDVSVQYVDCSQVQEAAAVQGQYGDAVAGASGIGSAAAAEISQELEITQEQVNACLGEIGGVDVASPAPAATATATAPAATATAAAPAAEAAAAPAASPSAAAAASPSASAPAPGITVLPETGGAPALALGVGALLIISGLLTRRLLR
jgi:hypothetical protein